MKNNTGFCSAQFCGLYLFLPCGFCNTKSNRRPQLLYQQFDFIFNFILSSDAFSEGGSETLSNVITMTFLRSNKQRKVTQNNCHTFQLGSKHLRVEIAFRVKIFDSEFRLVCSSQNFLLVFPSQNFRVETIESKISSRNF